MCIVKNSHTALAHRPFSNSPASFYSWGGYKKKKRKEKEAGGSEQYRSWDTVFTTSADLFSTSHHENIEQCGKCKKKKKKKKKKKVKQLSQTSAEQAVCKCMLARCYISIWLDIILLYLSRLVFKTCRWWDFFCSATTFAGRSLSKSWYFFAHLCSK